VGEGEIELAVENARRDKPSIVVFYLNHLSPLPELKTILSGIEEEGIPFETARISSEIIDIFTAQELAYRACKESRLGVGIGMSETEVALTHEKLPAKRPLFTLRLPADGDALRVIGSNAARLVKRMPFKAIN
jgi:hypothetical protein